MHNIRFDALYGQGDPAIALYSDCASVAFACDADCGIDPEQDELSAAMNVELQAGVPVLIELANEVGPFLAGSLIIRAPDLPTMPARVWSGEDVTFTKPDYAMVADAISPGVSIARSFQRPIYNSAQENRWTPVCAGVSPRGTRWALGRAADHASLEFTDFIDAAGGFPPGLVGQDAVLHLVRENVFLDIRFIAWTQGGVGGGFAYERATCPCDLAPIGPVDITDLLLYLDAWFAGDASADLNSAGVDVTDLLMFLECWLIATAGATCG